MRIVADVVPAKTPRHYSFACVRLLFAWFLCSSWQIAAAAEESCPHGPFETDRDRIATALATLPALAKSPGGEHQSYSEPKAWTLTDGVISEGGGSFATMVVREGGPVSVSARLEYDSRRYVARHVRTVATLRHGRLVDERYVIRTVRPTVEQARGIACLVNQLLNPGVPPAKEPAQVEGPRAIPMGVIVSAPPRPCEVEYFDGWDSLVLRVGGEQVTVSPALSCDDAFKIQGLLERAVGAPFLPW
jgi:hypothetical protein